MKDLEYASVDGESLRLDLYLPEKSESKPPLLISHGDKDQVVPLSQSEYMHKRYQEVGLESSLHIIEGAGHGGPQFSDSTGYELVKQFLDRHIKQAAAARGSSIRIRHARRLLELRDRHERLRRRRRSARPRR